MRSKRLFNKYDAYTEEASEISSDVLKYVHELMKKYPDVNLRDLSIVVGDAADLEISTQRILDSIELKRKERDGRDT